jgi:ribonuclease HII
VRGAATAEAGAPDDGRAPPATVLGVDEAGRGSVLGPLVVGGFVLPAPRLPELVAIGVRDSKLLTAARRSELFAALAELGRRLSVTLPPAAVDAAVARGELNLLEARAFAHLVHRARASVAYVDACDPVAVRFGRTVAALAGGAARVRAFHHADRDFPIVGAASIVAKVLRDRAIARLGRTVGRELGSGYPSDPRTVACVRAVLGGPAPHVAWIRHSWRTAARLKPRPPISPLERFGG